MSSYGLSFPADLLTATGTRNSIKNSLWKLITEEREDISLERSFLHVLVWLRYFDKFNPLIHFFPSNLSEDLHFAFSSLLACRFPHFLLRSLSFFSTHVSLTPSVLNIFDPWHVMWCTRVYPPQTGLSESISFSLLHPQRAQHPLEYSDPSCLTTLLMLKESLCFSPKPNTECLLSAVAS